MPTMPQTEAEHVSHKLVSTTEAGAHLGVHGRTIRRWIAKGLVPAYRVGPHLVKVRLDEVEACLIRDVRAGA